MNIHTKVSVALCTYNGGKYIKEQLESIINQTYPISKIVICDDGSIEGINTKNQLAKRRTRGFSNIDNFIHMIYFISGKLKLDYPHDSL